MRIMKTQFNQKYLCSETGQVLEKEQVIVTPVIFWGTEFLDHTCSCHRKDVMNPYSVLNIAEYEQERRKSLGLEAL